MKALHRKALRDLWLMRGQALAIALVIASGIAMLVMSQATLDSLRNTAAQLYLDDRFSDVWSQLKRAPNSVADRSRELPGVAEVERPPVGSTLGQWGLNMMDFINPFNEATKGMMGKDVIVHIQVYEDRTFTWNCLGQPVDDMIRSAIGIQKGSGKPHVDKVGKITRAQLEEIAKTKMDQLNAIDLDGAVKVVAGTARSMGVEVVD